MDSPRLSPEAAGRRQGAGRHFAADCRLVEPELSKSRCGGDFAMFAERYSAASERHSYRGNTVRVCARRAVFPHYANYDNPPQNCYTRNCETL